MDKTLAAQIDANDDLHNLAVDTHERRKLPREAADRDTCMIFRPGQKVGDLEQLAVAVFAETFDLYFEHGWWNGAPDIVFFKKGPCATAYV